MKLMLFLLIISGASEQHKLMSQKVFHKNTKALGGILGMFCAHSIKGFTKISS